MIPFMPTICEPRFNPSYHEQTNKKSEADPKNPVISGGTNQRPESSPVLVRKEKLER